MAGIDKTYTKDYKDYKDYYEWALDKRIKFVYGNKTLYKNLSDFVYILKEEDFDGINQIPIMNTPTWVDKYLYDNCQFDFVLERLREVYPKDYLDNLIINKIPEDFKQNRKVKIKETNITTLPLSNKGLGRYVWWLQTEDDFNFSEDLNSWVHMDSNFPAYTNTMHFKTVKSMVRLLRKMYLPKGLKFRLIGNYIGEEYEVIIK